MAISKEVQQRAEARAAKLREKVRALHGPAAEQLEKDLLTAKSVDLGDFVNNETRCGWYMILRRPGLGSASVWFIGTDKVHNAPIVELVGP